jgi:hypothetical protein
VLAVEAVVVGAVVEAAVVAVGAAVTPWAVSS